MTTRPLTKRQREKFLAHLASSLNVTEACRIAGLGRTTAYRLKSRDEEFRAAWDEAVAEAVDKLEAAVFRYATEGAVETLYDADGNVVSRRVREDPTSAARLLAAHRPDLYSEKRRLELAARIEHEVVGPSVAISWLDVLELARRREFGPGELGPGEPAGEVIGEEDS
ncbi:MAG: hypothetical protein ACJ752_00610 [Gaiellaceae bacterium]